MGTLEETLDALPWDEERTGNIEIKDKIVSTAEGRFDLFPTGIGTITITRIYQCTGTLFFYKEGLVNTEFIYTESDESIARYLNSKQVYIKITNLRGNINTTYDSTNNNNDRTWTNLNYFSAKYILSVGGTLILTHQEKKYNETYCTEYLKFNGVTLIENCAVVAADTGCPCPDIQNMINAANKEVYDAFVQWNGNRRTAKIELVKTLTEAMSKGNQDKFDKLSKEISDLKDKIWGG